MTALLDEAKKGEARLYLQFGGQGARWWGEIGKIFKEPELSPFFECAFNAVLEEYERMRDHPFYEKGFALREWLDGTVPFPDEEYLETAPLSLPMIQALQLAHLERFLKNGYPLEELLPVTTGVTGHSQGLISAAYLSQAFRVEDPFALLAKYMKFAFLLGFFSQSVYPHPTPSVEQIEAGRAIEEDLYPAPMAVLRGSRWDEVETVIQTFNASLPEQERLYTGLYNTPTNRVLCAPRESLLAFYQANKTELEALDFELIFLTISCPFHSPHLKEVRSRMEPELDRIGFRFSGKDLALPCISFYDGKGLADEIDLGVRLIEDMAIHQLYWDRAVMPALQNGTTHIIDFGPGKTSTKLTREVIASHEQELIYKCVAIPKDYRFLTGG